MNFRSLRFKLSWTIGLAIALVVVCIGLIRFQTVAYRVRLSFDADLQSDAQLFISHLEFRDDGYSWSAEGLPPMDAMTVDEVGPYFLITDLDGRVFRKDLLSRYVQIMLERGELKSLLGRESGFSEAYAVDRTEYRFVSIEVPEQRKVVHVGRAVDSVSGVLDEYLFVYFYSVPIILIVSVAAGWVIAGRTLRPFDEVSRTAEQITSKNLNIQMTPRHKEVEIVRLVHAFNSMVSRLNLSFEQMGKFNADVAHELRTPLAILQGETEIALRSSSLSEDIRSVLVSNLEELDRLKRLVNDLLTLAEADAGKQILNPKPLDLRPLLSDLVEQMRMLASDRAIEINLILVGDVLVYADELWIRRAMLNLLDNAIKYSNEGGSIRVCCRAEGNELRLSVADGGIGISAQDLPHIFERLFRADRARTRVRGGAGLGLALVKWVVEAHQGKIEVKSQLDHGAEFAIKLPKSRNQKPEAGSQNIGLGNTSH
jgi:heavy metal sensor kinase